MRRSESDLPQAVVEVVNDVSGKCVIAVHELSFGVSLARTGKITLKGTSACVLEADSVPIVGPSYSEDK
jgi:hypothetical protein